MQCIYLDRKDCLAQIEKLKPPQYYQPSKEEIINYCVSVEFYKCSRFKEYQVHLSIEQ